MHNIQKNEDIALQYVLKLIPDLNIFDIVERECIEHISLDENGNPTPVLYNLFYYDMVPSLEEINNEAKIFKYTIHSNFKRAIFKFDLNKMYIGEMSGGSALMDSEPHIATSNVANPCPEDTLNGFNIDKNTGYLLDSDGNFIIHDEEHNIIEKKSQDAIKFLTIRVDNAKFNSFTFDGNNCKYLVIIDELGSANGEFKVYINNYDNNLNSVIGVCF